MWVGLGVVAAAILMLVAELLGEPTLSPVDKIGRVVAASVFWIVFMMLTFVMCIWGVIHPRRRWQALSGFLHRAGSEPTDFYLGWLRARNFFGVVSGALVVVLVLFLLRGNASAS